MYATVVVLGCELGVKCIYCSVLEVKEMVESECDDEGVSWRLRWSNRCKGGGMWKKERKTGVSFVCLFYLFTKGGSGLVYIWALVFRLVGWGGNWV